MNSKPSRFVITFVLLVVCCLATWMSTERTANAQPPNNVIAFHANNWESAFSVQSDVVGFYRIFPDRLEVHITSITLRLNKKLNVAVPRHVQNFYMGVAVPLDGARWKIERQSTPVALDLTLSPGDEATRENLDVTIPVDGTIDGYKSWLACTVVVDLTGASSSREQVGYTYSHCPTNLLGGPRK